MKMIAQLFISVFCILTFFGSPMQASEPVPYNVIARNLMKKTSERLQKKHCLHHGCVNGGMMGCVKLMGLEFHLSRAMDKDEARAMLIDCVQEFLEDINKDQTIRKYLQVYPFDTEHIEITIFMRTPEEGTLYYPDFSVVTARRGKIMYYAKDQEKEFGYKTKEEESFEDAVKIVQSQNPPQKLAE